MAEHVVPSFVYKQEAAISKSLLVFRFASRER